MTPGLLVQVGQTVGHVVSWDWALAMALGLLV